MTQIHRYCSNGQSQVLRWIPQLVAVDLIALPAQGLEDIHGMRKVVEGIGLVGGGNGPQEAFQ